MDSAAERNTDLSDFRSEAGESASSPSAEAAPLSTGVLLVDGDFFVDEEVSVDEEPAPADEPDGLAYAIPGVLAMAAPTPNVTANAPTRPMCLA